MDVQISSSGDAPAVSISCEVGNNYTLTLVHSFPKNFGVLERKYCATGVISFSSFNLNTKLFEETGDTQWWRWINSPLEYIIKNTTSDYLSVCNEGSCPKSNLAGAFNSYNQDAYSANDSTFPTVAAGPIFNTDVYETNAIWTNSANGNGSLNYVEPPKYSSVLFLPGIESSRLYRQGVVNCSANCEDRLWEPNIDSDVEALFMDENGQSIDTGIYTRDVVSEAYGTLNIYKSFLSDLEKMKSTDHTIADYSAVPYDWRLSLNDILSRGVKSGNNISYIGTSNSPYILSELQRLASTSNNGKVTIVAHSNGGLLAKTLLIKLADENSPLLAKVDKLILVAVPQLGTPSAIPAMLHGYDQGISFKVYSPLHQRVARQLAQNLRGGYNLIPSDKYFNSVGTPVIQIDDNLQDWKTKFGQLIGSQVAQHNFLIDTLDRVENTNSDISLPDYLRGNLLIDAENIHISLDNWTPPSTMQVIEIAGWGIPTTISGVKYYKEKEKIKMQPITTVDGDGTVVVPSALWSNGVTASTTKYWVDLGLWNKLSNRVNNLQLRSIVHKDILEIPEVRNLIKESIEQISPSGKTYISTSSPEGNFSDHLIYSLHSPLTLDFYDNLGNHTGVSTTTGQIEEQIPGTYFIQIGEEKYVFTNSGVPMNISMSGYDSGTFTFTIEQLQGDNTVSKVEFKDIPTTINTKVKMSITGDMQTLSNLDIDSDNNGISDITLTPIIGGTVSYTPPVIVATTSLAGGNGPIIMQNIYPVASTSMSVLEVASTTSTTTDVISLKITNIKSKNKKSTVSVSKPLVKSKPSEMSGFGETAQVVLSDSKYPSTFGRLLRKFVGWIGRGFK